VKIDTFVAGANAKIPIVGGVVVHAGVDAGFSLFKGSASLFDLNLGLGVESGASIKDGSLNLHLAGYGMQIGRKASISVFGASFDIDLAASWVSWQVYLSKRMKTGRSTHQDKEMEIDIFSKHCSSVTRTHFYVTNV
jgi:hypothetical protein